MLILLKIIILCGLIYGSIGSIATKKHTNRAIWFDSIWLMSCIFSIIIPPIDVISLVCMGICSILIGSGIFNALNTKYSDPWAAWKNIMKTESTKIF